MLFQLPMVCLTQYNCTKKSKFINRIFVLMCWWIGLCARVACTKTIYRFLYVRLDAGKVISLTKKIPPQQILMFIYLNKSCGVDLSAKTHCTVYGFICAYSFNSNIISIYSFLKISLTVLQGNIHDLFLFF